MRLDGLWSIYTYRFSPAISAQRYLHVSISVPGSPTSILHSPMMVHRSHMLSISCRLDTRLRGDRRK